MSRLRQSPSYLEWLKSQKWDGQLPLVVGGGAGGEETPFISIPTSGNGIPLVVLMLLQENKATNETMRLRVHEEL